MALQEDRERAKSGDYSGIDWIRTIEYQEETFELLELTPHQKNTIDSYIKVREISLLSDVTRLLKKMVAKEITPQDFLKALEGFSKIIEKN